MTLEINVGIGSLLGRTREGFLSSSSVVDGLGDREKLLHLQGTAGLTLAVGDGSSIPLVISFGIQTGLSRAVLGRGIIDAE